MTRESSHTNGQVGSTIFSLAYHQFLFVATALMAVLVVGASVVFALINLPEPLLGSPVQGSPVRIAAGLLSLLLTGLAAGFGVFIGIRKTRKGKRNIETAHSDKGEESDKGVDGGEEIHSGKGESSKGPEGIEISQAKSEEQVGFKNLESLQGKRVRDIPVFGEISDSWLQVYMDIASSADLDTSNVEAFLTQEEASYFQAWQERRQELAKQTVKELRELPKDVQDRFLVELLATTSSSISPTIAMASAIMRRMEGNPSRPEQRNP